MTASAVSPLVADELAAGHPSGTLPEVPAGFDEFLARAGNHRPPSVGLSRMLDQYEQGGAPGLLQAGRAAEVREDPADVHATGVRDSVTGTPRAAGSSTTPTTAPDDWGVAATRPHSTDQIDAVGTRVLAAGERYLGVPYRWGGTDPASGFDCSGFVQQVYADLGVSLPRVSIDQSRQGTAVPDLDTARAGDLVFWYGTGDRPNHIGIYAGQGRMLVAPRTGDVVRYQEISRTPHEIRRVIH